MNRRALFRRYGPSFQDHIDELAPLIPDTAWDLFHIRADIELLDANSFGVIIRGHDLRYHARDRQFTWGDHTVPAEPDEDSRLRLQILVDRTSMELFAGTGEISASFCFLPAAADVPLEFYAEEGRVRFASLTIIELGSAWA